MSRPHTKESLIATAKTLFAQRGYEGMSMRELASALHVTQAALYYHFKDKDALYLAVMEKVAEGPVSRLKTAKESSSDARAQLAAVVKQLAVDLNNDRELCRLLFWSLLDEDRQRGKLLGQRVFGHGIEIFSSIAAEVWPQRDPCQSAISVIAATVFPYAVANMGDNIDGWQDRALEPKTLAEHLMAMFGITDKEHKD
ncbi:MAG: helix-turn-helix domain-containing protein [Sutterellaceae bacterium]|nr:helix-turn-helix domain-containing protein [Sutterellaceae bacterium]